MNQASRTLGFKGVFYSVMKFLFLERMLSQSQEPWSTSQARE